MVKGNSHTRLYEAHIPSPLPTFESLKIPFSEPQIFILQTLVSTRSLAQEKFQSIPPLEILDLLYFSHWNSDSESRIWLRKRRRKRLSSKFQKPSPYALTTVDLQAIRPQTTCVRSASAPPLRRRRRQLPEPWRVATRCPAEAQTRDPAPRGPPSEWTRWRRPAWIGRRTLPQLRRWRRSGRWSGRWIGAPDAGGRSGSPDSGAGAGTCSALSIGTRIGTSAATITRPPVARLSRGKIR